MPGARVLAAAAAAARSGWHKLPLDVLGNICARISQNDVVSLSLADRATRTAVKDGLGYPGLLRLSLPVPPAFFSRCWAAPGAFSRLPEPKRKRLLCLLATSGSLANLRFAGERCGLERPLTLGEVLCAAAEAGHVALCRELVFQRDAAQEWSEANSLSDGVSQTRMLVAAAASGHLYQFAWLVRRLGLRRRGLLEAGTADLSNQPPTGGLLLLRNVLVAAAEAGHAAFVEALLPPCGAAASLLYPLEEGRRRDEVWQRQWQQPTASLIPELLPELILAAVQAAAGLQLQQGRRGSQHGPACGCEGCALRRRPEERPSRSKTSFRPAGAAGAGAAGPRPRLESGQEALRRVLWLESRGYRAMPEPQKGGGAAKGHSGGSSAAGCLAVNQAALAGNLPVLAFFMGPPHSRSRRPDEKKQPPRPDAPTVEAQALSPGRCPPGLWLSLFAVALTSAQAEAAHWVLSVLLDGDHWFYEELMRLAVQSGCVPLARLMREAAAAFPWDREAVWTAAARCGSGDMLLWLQEAGCDMEKSAQPLVAAAVNADMATLQRLRTAPLHYPIDWRMAGGTLTDIHNDDPHLRLRLVAEAEAAGPEAELMLQYGLHHGLFGDWDDMHGGCGRKMWRGLKRLCCGGRRGRRRRVVRKCLSCMETSVLVCLLVCCYPCIQRQLD
eukprot:XP_001698503.1 predicted protein [Chlamydomonas reinhardtii]